MAEITAPEDTAPPPRQTTVLFAGVVESKEPEATRACLEALGLAIDNAGGRVIKIIVDEIMALFPTPQTAASAAVAMQKQVDALPDVAGSKLGVRIGFHCGPVLQRDADVFGDTVNLAARLAKLAAREQIITSSETAEALGRKYAPVMRQLYEQHIKGKAEEVQLCELVWRLGDATAQLNLGRERRAKPAALHLQYRGREVERRRDIDAISFGRDAECGLVIEDSNVSRRHCTIERRGDKFVLADHSSNGTYVTEENSPEISIKREEFTLGKHGWIAFGLPRAATEEIVEYFCD
jgi:class 3 adenylate cyclase